VYTKEPHGVLGQLNVRTLDVDSDVTGFGKHNRLVVFWRFERAAGYDSGRLARSASFDGGTTPKGSKRLGAPTPERYATSVHRIGALPYRGVWGFDFP